MFRKFLTSKKGLIIFSIIFVIFIIVVLPYFANLTESKTNSSFSPDTGFFYSAEIFYDNMEIYGQTGRDFYILMRWTFDLIWPLVYTLFFISIITNLTTKMKKEKRIYFLSVPIIAVIFDLLENISASINVGIFPNQSIFLLRLLQIFSLFKWIFIFLTLLVIIYSLFIFFRRNPSPLKYRLKRTQVKGGRSYEVEECSYRSKYIRLFFRVFQSYLRFN